MAHGHGENALIAAAREVQSMRAKARKSADEHKQQIQEAVCTAIMGGTGWAFGYASKRYDKKRTEVAGVPFSAVIGGCIILGSLAGVLPDDPKILAAGQGAMTAFLVQKGQDMGADAAAKAA